MSTDDTPDDFPGDRIAKVLSRAGVASRRDAERMISEGRVKVNGKPITSPALNVGPKDILTVDGTNIGPPAPVRLWLYHKPAGVVTSAKDDEGRPTVFDQMPEGMPYVMTIGRLDLSSEGLLLLTNDGEIKRRLELPSTGWLRRYRVRVNGEVGESLLGALQAGVTIDGTFYQPMEVQFDRQQGANAWLTVGLREGKNREIRRVMEHLGVQVNRLIRISYGPFQLGELEAGAVQEIRSKVVRDQLGLDKGSDAPAGRPVAKVANRPLLSSGARAPVKPGIGTRRPRPLVAEETGDGTPHSDAPARTPRYSAAPQSGAPRGADGDVTSPSASLRTKSKPAGPRGGAERGNDRGSERGKDRSDDRKPRAPRAEGDAPRKFTPRKDGDTAPRGDRKPYARRDDAATDRKPYARRDDAGTDRKPYARRDDAGTDRKPYARRDDAGTDRKPYARRDGDSRPGGDRKPYAKRDDAGADRKPYARRDGDSRPGGDRKPYAKRDDAGADRKPYARRDESGPRSAGKPGRPERSGSYDRSAGSDRPARSGGPRPEGDRGPRPSRDGDSAGRPYKGGAPRSAGPSGPRSGPGGDRPAGNRPSGPRSGGKPGSGPRKGPPRKP